MAQNGKKMACTLQIPSHSGSMPTKRLAIIGGGNSGTAAFVNTVHHLSRLLPEQNHREPPAHKIKIVLFNKDRNYGPGYPYNLHLPPILLLNHEISDMGEVSLRERGSGPLHYGDFSDWLAKLYGFYQSQQEALEEAFFEKAITQEELDSLALMKSYCEQYQYDLGPLINRENDWQYAPRAFYGMYLMQRFKEAEKVAKAHAIDVTTIEAEVTDITKLRAGLADTGTHHLEISYTYQNAAGKTVQATIGADEVVLALGLWPGSVPDRFKDAENYIHDPFDKRLIEGKIAPGSTVLVTGTGPSGLDVVKLLGACPDTKIILGSRDGLLPAVRGPRLPRSNKILTRANIARGMQDGFIPLNTVIHLFKEELRDAYSDTRQHPVVQEHFALIWQAVTSSPHSDQKALFEYNLAAAKEAIEHGKLLVWRGVLSDFAALQADAADNLREYVYAHLSDEDKAAFARTFSSIYWAWQVAIPVPVAERIDGLIKEKRLTVTKGLDRDNVEYHSQMSMFSVAAGASGEEKFSAAYYVNGDSNPGPVRDSPLLARLAEKGLITPNNFGGVEFDHCTLRAKGMSDHLYAMGALQVGEKRNSPPNSLNISTDGALIGRVLAEALCPHLFHAQDHRVDYARMRRPLVGSAVIGENL